MNQNKQRSVMNLGLISGTRIKSDENEADIYLMTVYLPDTNIITLHLSDSVARTIWSELTTMLFPRAADQLTSGAQTAIAARNQQKYITHLVNIRYHEAEQLIEIYGMRRLGGWSIFLTVELAESLWTELEDIFQNVGRRG